MAALLNYLLLLSASRYQHKLVNLTVNAQSTVKVTRGRDTSREMTNESMTYYGQWGK